MSNLLYLFRRMRRVWCSNVQAKVALPFKLRNVQLRSKRTPSPMPNDDARETFLCLSMGELPLLGKSPEPEEPEEAMIASKSLPVDFFQKRWPSCKYFDLKKLFEVFFLS